MLDPESQRKRTVQNVLDLRQNLEDTMSSLRGSHLSHSCADSSNVGYDSDETNARSISSLSNRSSPLSWCHGQSSPRLQAGDAPSSTGSGYQGSKSSSQYTAQTMPARCSSRLSSTSRIELIEGLDDADLKSGYLSDTDLQGKSLQDDDDNLANGWDESSSISSGLSDGDDREQTPYHQLILSAVDGGIPEKTGSAKINIRVLDSNDNVPLFDSSVYKVKLLENSPKDTLVVKLNATDLDEGTNGEIYYSFSSYTPERVRQMFSMETNTGEIRVRSNVDYEETHSYEMYIQAMDKGPGAVAAHCKVVVDVVDVNDNVPQIVLSSLSSPVREDARADTVVALISVTDQDSGANKQVSLEIPAGLPFKIKSFRNYYTLVTSAFLDRETTDAYNVTLSATDGGNPPLSSQKTIQVDVADVNDNPPRFEQTSYTVYVTENNAPGASLCTVKAQDADIKENARITYTVLNDNNHGIPVTSYVSVKADTGEAYALRAFDYESLREFHFQVKAQDGGIPPLSRVATVYIYIMDQNDHAPLIVSPPGNGTRSLETVQKNADPGALVTKVVAYDADAGTNAWLVYELETATDMDLFKVHQHTGEIKTTRRILEDNSTSFALTVVVKDHGQPPLSSTATINVAVIEVVPKVAPDTKKVTRPHSTLFFSNVTLYLIVALSATTFVFLVTVVVLAIVRCHAYCSQPGSCSPCCGSQKPPPDGGSSSVSAGGGGGGGAPGQPNSNVVLRRDLKVEPHYIEVRGNGSLTKTYCYKTCLTATSGSDTFMFYNTGRPISGTWGSGADRFFTSGSGFVRRLSMPDASLQICPEPKAPNADWRYSASLRAGVQGAVHMEESSVVQGAQGMLVQNWPTVSSAADGEGGGELSPPVGAGVNSNSWHFRYGAGQGYIPPQPLKPGEIPPEAFIIPGSPAIISIRHDPGPVDDKGDFISFGKKEEAKKKKKKSWVYELRSSFNKAFSKKGTKSGPYADIEEIATPESSAPSSPKVHGVGDTPQQSIKSVMSASSSGLCEGGEVADDKVVTELRTELWEKERKLTDIRLEALNSAHQLEQLQEAMISMQRTVESLKAENDHLRTGNLSPCPSPGPSNSASQSSGLTALGSSSPRQSVAMHMPKSYSRGLSEGSSSDVHSADSLSFSSQRDDHRVRVVVCVADLRVFKEEVKQQDFFIGTVRVNGRMDWVMLDSAVSQAFKVYIAKVDPTFSLGLSTDSIYSYSMGHIKRVLGGEAPETQPSRCMSRGPSSITVALKGLKEKCVDSLVFETLIPKTMMQHYISLLLKHRRLILSGPSGTGKSYLASRLAEYLVDRSAREVTNGIVITFNMHRQSCKDLQLYLSNLANQIDRESSASEIPLVLILDDIHDPVSISELVNGALTCKYHKCPYIIGTSNQPVKMTANHSLHLSFRMVTFSNNVEPANGFLVRYLHRKLMESEDERNLTNEDLIRVLDWVPKLWYHLHTFLEKHSTSDFLIGPCFFLSCPVTVDDFRSWFIDLWNHSIIPYLQEGAKDGIKVHGQKAVWEDPVEWVRGTLPWPSAQQDQAKLFHLPPPSIGSSSPCQASEEKSHKETPPSSLESDPLMAMLLKLQEAANYIESPDKEDLNLPKL
uniref:Neuron navigator 1 n=1 Tax=Nothobranchius kuhntae TaxID=321403 RepID=A0A1A8I3V0_NOTKU